MSEYSAEPIDGSAQKKYELVDPIEHEGRTIYRVRSLARFADVYPGQLGGFIECEHNLSHHDECWVYGDAIVYENAIVEENASVRGDAVVKGQAIVSGYARIHGHAEVSGRALVYGGANVCGHACVGDSVKIRDNALVSENASVCGGAIVCGSATVMGEAAVRGISRVSGTATVEGNAVIVDRSDVTGVAIVSGHAYIEGDAVVSKPGDYAVYKNTWSSGRWITYTASNHMWTAGCFHGSGKSLVRKAYSDSRVSGDCYKAIVKAQEAIEKAKKRKSWLEWLS